jgi:CPA2 family monovalent cation:H+ antiporter-2
VDTRDNPFTKDVRREPHMTMDPIIPLIVSIAFGVLVMGAVLHRVRQPLIVGYICVGVLLGPHVSGIIPDAHSMERLGELGLVLLLFFLGTEMSLPELLRRWRIPFLGTLLQVLASVGIVLLLGSWLDWPLGRSILLGFVISLSSSAVIIPLLKEWGEADTELGQDILGINLAQDLAVVPMLIVVGALHGEGGSGPPPALQVLGVGAVAGLLVFLSRRAGLRIPLRGFLLENEEAQVFFAFALCFGAALATNALGLSAAMGAFLGGIIVGSTGDLQWVKEHLRPFRILLVALFFLGVGAVLDLPFLYAHLGTVMALVAAALITNTFVNAVTLRVLGMPWSQGFYGGAILAGIGEFSFVLAILGVRTGAITDFGYQLTVAIIALTMVASPFWVRLYRPRRTATAEPT